MALNKRSFVKERFCIPTIKVFQNLGYWPDRHLYTFIIEDFTVYLKGWHSFFRSIGVLFTKKQRPIRGTSNSKDGKR
jgi:hypothetical protein